MRAKVGDKLQIHASRIGAADQIGRIVEVRGADGAPPYVVEFPDGHMGLVFPGPDALVESPRTSRAAGCSQGSRQTRRVHTRAGW